MSTTLEGLQWEQENGYHALENAAEKIDALQAKIKELETVVDFWKTLSEYWETHSGAIEQALKENEEKLSKAEAVCHAFANNFLHPLGNSNTILFEVYRDWLQEK